MTLREAAQQALETLESWSRLSLWDAEDQKALDTLRAALEQPEQEPVAWIESPHGAIRRNMLYRVTAPQSLAWSIPLYAHPPRREWQGLTEEEREQATGWSVEHIEAALKEKNYG
jgi:hypothetical protein